MPSTSAPTLDDSYIKTHQREFPARAILFRFWFSTGRCIAHISIQYQSRANSPGGSTQGGRRDWVKMVVFGILDRLLRYVPPKKDMQCTASAGKLNNISRLKYILVYRVLWAQQVMQGFGLGIRLGMTYEDLRQLVGIHPTVAEEITLLEITRR